LRRETAKDRAAWTAQVTGEAPKRSKYGAVRTNGYASKREAQKALDLHALASVGAILNLREQVPFILVPGNGRVGPIRYISDFCWEDKDGALHVADAKGMPTPVYKLKKKMMFLLLGIEVEEL
jgi:hypothetical protein